MNLDKENAKYLVSLFAGRGASYDKKIKDCQDMLTLLASPALSDRMPRAMIKDLPKLQETLNEEILSKNRFDSCLVELRELVPNFNLYWDTEKEYDRLHTLFHKAESCTDEEVQAAQALHDFCAANQDNISRIDETKPVWDIAIYWKERNEYEAKNAK